MAFHYNNLNYQIKRFVWYEALDFIKISYPVYICETDIIYSNYIINTLMENQLTYKDSIKLIKILLSEFRTNNNFSYFYFQDKCYFSLTADPL